MANRRLTPEKALVAGLTTTILSPKPQNLVVLLSGSPCLLGRSFRTRENPQRLPYIMRESIDNWQSPRHRLRPSKAAANAHRHNRLTVVGDGSRPCPLSHPE